MIIPTKDDPDREWLGFNIYPPGYMGKMPNHDPIYWFKNPPPPQGWLTTDRLRIFLQNSNRNPRLHYWSIYIHESLLR